MFTINTDVHNKLNTIKIPVHVKVVSFTLAAMRTKGRILRKMYLSGLAQISKSVKRVDFPYGFFVALPL